MSNIINCFKHLISKGYNIYKKTNDDDILVSGPISFVKISGGGKTIYLFGDYHSNKYSICGDNAVDFSVFLDNTLEKYKQQGKVIDIFFEQTSLRTKVKKFKSFVEPNRISKLMSSVFKNDFYMKCLHDDITDCFHRFHGIDTRHIKTNFNSFIVYQDKKDDYKKLYDLYKKMVKIRTVDDMEIEKYKILKQIENTQEGEKLIKLFNESFQRRRYKLDKMEKIIEEIKKSGSSSYLKTLLYKYISKFRSIGMLIMDFYTTARILRRFKDETSPENCIVMVGHAHVKNMIHIFETLDYKIEILQYKKDPKEDLVEKNFQCINMNKNLYESLFG